MTAAVIATTAAVDSSSLPVKYIITESMALRIILSIIMRVQSL